MTTDRPEATPVARLLEEKRDARTKAISRRDAIPETERAASSRAIAACLLAEPAWQAARVVSVTLAFGSEVGTDALVAAALAGGKRVVLPRVNRARRILDLFEVDDLAQQVAPGVWGIREPIPERARPAESTTIDLVIVPGVAFDRHGGRLGYGGGYYDRLLPTLPVGVPRIAPAFDAQIVPVVPRGTFDLRVDILITATQRFDCNPMRVRPW